MDFVDILPITNRIKAISFESINVPDGVGYLIFWSGNNEVLIPELSRRIRENLRAILINAGWNERTIDRIVNNLKVAIQRNGILVSITDKIFKAQELGVKPRYMTHLVGKTVPIETPFGVIFRKVTFESIRKGSWFNRGIEPNYYLRQALEEVLPDIEMSIAEQSRYLFEELHELLNRMMAGESR